jgi:TRAP-type C4-dicarboxylate transport system substrate-binding protein
VAQEYPDTHVIYMAFTAGYHLMTKNKAIRTLDDFKGLKIRAIGAGMTDCVKALGAVPVSMPASEIYNAIERGVIDGTLFHRGGLVEFNFKDVVNYLTYLGLAGPVSTATMNLKTWNSLPPNVRQAFMDLEEPAAPFAGKMYDDNDLRGLEAFRAKGGEEIYLSDADMKKAFELFKPIVDKWVAETAAKGKPAAATLDYFMQEINKIKY